MDRIWASVNLIDLIKGFGAIYESEIYDILRLCYYPNPFSFKTPPRKLFSLRPPLTTARSAELLLDALLHAAFCPLTALRQL